MKPQNGVATIGVYELPVAEAGSNSLINAGSFCHLKWFGNRRGRWI